MKLVTIILWLLCQLVRLPFRRWKLFLLFGMGAINMLSFLAAVNTELIYSREYERLMMVDHAQRLSERAIGVAELEMLRSGDLAARLELVNEELAALRQQLEESGK